MKKKEKKADYEALHSPLMRVPRIDVATVRDLIDLGFADTYELAGRSPEALYESLKVKKPETPIRRLHCFRMMVYFAETDDPDPKKLNPQSWTD